MNTSKGFTLTEILVTASVSMILLGSIYLGINSVQRGSTGLERKITAQQDVRPMLELMAAEIRMASYNPTFALNMWLDPTNCFSTSTTQTYRGIQEATANSLTIEMDITDTACTGTDGDGVIGDCNEIIRYNYVAANQYITRQTKRSPPGTCNSTSQPFLGETLASGNPRTVRVVNDTNGNGAYDDGVDIPLFRYFDGTGALIPYASLPTRIPDIRRIEITVAVQTEDIDPNTGQRRSLVYSTSIIPRNHAL